MWKSSFYNPVEALPVWVANIDLDRPSFETGLYSENLLFISVYAINYTGIYFCFTKLWLWNSCELSYKLL